ncbi:MAG: acetyltransferase [Bradyrhizobiaceae bacterium]|nr:acetyltransferase [Bradyrhizobiaceae bacterium]
MRLRPAVPADVPLLQHWSAQPHIVAASGDFNEFDWQGEVPRRVGWREILIAESDGWPIGVMQIIDPAREETHYWGDCEENLRAIDIWIGEAADLGKGYGTQMMRLALDRCFANPAVKAVLVDPLASNTRAHRFYERLGFVAAERRMFGTDDCVVYRLDRAVRLPSASAAR